MSISIFVTCCLFVTSAFAKMGQKVQFAQYNPYYYSNSYIYSNDTLSDNSTYYSDYGSYRIRYFKAITINLNLTIDIQISIPLPGDDDSNNSIDIDIPINIMIRNKTLIKVPFPDKPIKLPFFYPVVKLPKLFSSYSPNYYSQASSYGGNNDLNQDSTYNYLDQPMHHLNKRNLAAHCASHRRDIFESLANALDKHGYQGQSCVKKIICQMAERDFLVESVLDEILEHLFVNFDEANLLKEYQEAEKYGKENKNCDRKYSCDFTLFQVL